MISVTSVRFPNTGGVHHFRKPEFGLRLNQYCVVETERGMHLAQVVRGEEKLPENFLNRELKHIVRPASERDMEQHAKNLERERDAHRLCRKKIQEHKLPMKLAGVNYTLDGKKAIFYFTAENRIDFRELVKELAQALRVKIEMRQIGVRDEARRLGGVGGCGRALCCASFIKDFISVSIRMAKDQNLSLNPTKVSGLCGRLMCCLAYEHERRAKKDSSQEGEQMMVDSSHLECSGRPHCEALADEAGTGEHRVCTCQDPHARETKQADSKTAAGPHQGSRRPQSEPQPEKNQGPSHPAEGQKNHRNQHFRAGERQAGPSHPNTRPPKPGHGHRPGPPPQRPGNSSR
jgi:cell fate regulator YaaT (PSP1 superfamily)